MAFTRRFDDDERIQIRLQQSIEQGLYENNCPGNNGTHPYFVEDPQIRIQKWGANLRTHCTDLESELLNINRPLNHDETNHFQYTNYKFQTPSEAMHYPSTRKLTTDQSRTTHPAWTYLGKEQILWQFPPLDPQENVCIPFTNNLSTRILEKDYYVAQIPCNLPSNGIFPLPSSRITDPRNHTLSYATK